LFSVYSCSATVCSLAGGQGNQPNNVTEISECQTTVPENNTLIPSSAPVERLSSFAVIIHSVNCQANRLSDEMFETLLLLKANVSIVKPE